MRNRLFTVCVLLYFCSFSSASQTTANEIQNTELHATEDQLRNQAIFLLKDNLSKSKLIKDLRQRCNVIIEASAVLWAYDQPFAETSLLALIEQSLIDYRELLSKENRSAEESSRIGDLEYVLKAALKTLTRKDAKNASLLRNKYFKIRQEILKAKNLNEELEMASEGLDVDEQRTLSMLSAIIQQRIPASFPKLILDLRAKNPAIAEILVRQAIQTLATNPNYRASDAIYLSMVVLGETTALIPLLNDAGAPNNFGILTYPLRNSNASFGSEHISNYLRNVQQFFSLRLTNRGGGVFDLPQDLLQSYFLLEKLKFYIQRFGLGDPEAQTNFTISVLASMQSRGFTPQTILDIKGYALRLAATNNPLGLDDGTTELERSENAKTPEEKLKYLINGTIQLIEVKQFEKAERRIFDIQESEVRDSLYLLLYMRAGLDAIELKNWTEFERRTEKLTDKRIRAFLYLKALSILASSKNAGTLIAEYVIKAEKNIGDISDRTAKASAWVFLTSLLFSLDKTESLQNIPSTINSINEASDYSGDGLTIEIAIPSRQGYFGERLGENSFRDLFSKLARSDWTDSQIQSLLIKSPSLQALAQITAAKAVLGRKDPRN